GGGIAPVDGGRVGADAPYGIGILDLRDGTGEGAARRGLEVHAAGRPAGDYGSRASRRGAGHDSLRMLDGDGDGIGVGAGVGVATADGKDFIALVRNRAGGGRRIAPVNGRRVGTNTADRVRILNGGHRAGEW